MENFTMKTVRCPICRHQLCSLKKLRLHILSHHSKMEISRHLIRTNSSNLIPKFVNMKRTPQRRKCAKMKSIYMDNNLKINYDENAVVIKDDNNNFVEFKFTTERPINNNLQQLDENTYHLEINVKKTDQSLDDKNGEFYECKCMARTPNINIKCNYCGVHFELIDDFIGHMQQHLKVFTCHLCSIEFSTKDSLFEHLNGHFEQQTFEHILNMEEEYKLNLISFNNYDNYMHSINNILAYLYYPPDYCYYRMKIVCDFCIQEMSICEYDKHLRMAHNFRI